MASDDMAPPPYNMVTGDSKAPDKHDMAQPTYPITTSYPVPPAPYPAQGPAPAPYYLPNPAQHNQFGYVAPSTAVSQSQAATVCTPDGDSYEVHATTGPVVITQTYPQPPHVDSYCLHTLLAMATLCCCPITSVIAFVLAGMATGRSLTDREAGRRLGRASLAVSVSGIIIVVVVAIIVVSVLCSAHSIDGGCYRHRARLSTFDCFARHHGSDGYCYWN